MQSVDVRRHGDNNTQEDVGRRGCRAWLHNPDAGKLGERAMECVFMGVDNLKKGFRLLRLSNMSMVVSRNVVFDESSFPLLDYRATVSDSVGTKMSEININVAGSSSLAGDEANVQPDSQSGTVASERAPREER